MKHSRLLITLLMLAVISGCVTNEHIKIAEDQPVFPKETFNIDSPHARYFSVESGPICEAARQALLSQGFVVVMEKLTLSARKFIQPAHGLEVDLMVAVDCSSDFAHPGHTQLYITGWEDHLAIKHNANAASLGVGALGAISLPVNAMEDSLVKVGVQMINDPTFYERFFTLVETIYKTRVQAPP